jgi:hypothetical protein
MIPRAMRCSFVCGWGHASFAAITLGVSTTSVSVQDVGGNQGDTWQQIAIHGNRANDGHILEDGMYIEGLTGGGGIRHNVPNHMAIEETTLSTGGNGAEFENGGIITNHVMKDGGNAFSFQANVTGANSDFNGTNINDDLRAQGLTIGSKVKRIWDYGASFGGPIKQDKIWFHLATRWWGAENYVPGNYFALDTGDPFHYTPDLSRPAFTQNYNRDPLSARLTWQATAKNKLTFYNSIQDNCVCYYQVDSTNTPEAAIDHHYRPARVTQVTWSNDRGGSGTASGTTSWTVSGITLQSGANVLTVTARDAAGNTGTDTLTVTYTPPDTTAPTVTITTRLSGASPEEIESQITKKIEEVVNTISGLDELRSVTIEGQSQIFATFVLEREITEAANDIREKVSGVVSEFPDGTEAPIIEKFDPDASPIMALVVSGKRSPREITELADKLIKRQLGDLAG